ncbi:hypothetical protein A7K94_0220550, partial [Modestobacter sp. VKM Ac-2676]
METVLVLDSAAVSTRGPRPDNQDSAVGGPLLVAIADGVGGNVGGAVASSLVATWLAPLAVGSTGEGSDDPVRVVASANERIRAAYTERPRLRTMATTLTAVHVDAEGLVLLHIGDSRGYLLSGGELNQVSTDHTLVQALIDAGSLTPAEARVHPQRSAVYAALHGADDDVAALDVIRLEAARRPGDGLLRRALRRRPPGTSSSGSSPPAPLPRPPRRCGTPRWPARRRTTSPWRRRRARDRRVPR